VYTRLGTWQRERGREGSINGRDASCRMKNNNNKKTGASTKRNRNSVFFWGK
jgi:hypothetical protein